LSDAEITELLIAHGAPPKVANQLTMLVGTTTHGLPVLATAVARFFAGRDWKFTYDQFESVLKAEFATNARQDARELVRLTVSDDESRELLYRLSLTIGGFSREVVVRVAQVSRQVALPLEKLNKLIGVWVHPFVSERTKASRKVDDPKWPEHALIFDTETRITADQSLTFGVFRIWTLVEDRYMVTQEGILYADDLPARDREVLEKYQQTAISDVPSFPPEFPLYSRSEFMRRVCWPAIKRDGALVCGLNLPFDLSRLALAWGKGDKNEWSLTMSQYANGVENKNFPHILIQPIDGKKAFIKLAKPWKPDEWKTQGKARFLDLRTLGWALFNRSFSLRSLCEELKAEHRKIDHEPTGKVTVEDIE